MSGFMRLAWGALALASLAGAAFAQVPGAVHVPAQRVAEVQAKGGRLAASPDATVSILRRTGPGQPEVHEKETDTYFILDGEATFVTGGALVGSKTTGPGQIRGTGIDGGQTVQLRKGDVMVVPAGVPHWFKDVSVSVAYYTVKAIRN